MLKEHQDEQGQIEVHQGKNVSQFRKMRGLTQEEFGKVFNLSRKTVAKIEATSKLTDEDIEKYANYFKVDAFYIRQATYDDMVSRFQNTNTNAGEGNSNSAFFAEEQEINYSDPLPALERAHEREVNRLEARIDKLEEKLTGAYERIRDLEKQQQMKNLLDEIKKLNNERKK